MSTKVMLLHDKGYVFDFFITNDRRITCAQDNRSFTIDQLTIELIDLHLDKLAGCYKYIHIVETCCGEKGLFVESCICVNSLLEGKFRPTASYADYTVNDLY